MLDGYKTWIGAGIMAIAAALTYLGNPELGKAFETFAFGVLTVGVAGKIAKSK